MHNCEESVSINNQKPTLNEEIETNVVLDLTSTESSGEHIKTVRTDAEGWQNACRKLAHINANFEVDGICTDHVYSFFKEISAAYDYDFNLRDCTMVFSPNTIGTSHLNSRH